MLEEWLQKEIDEKAIHRLKLVAGIGYGIVFAVLFSLLLWGHDGWSLAASHANMAWLKLLIGLPIAIVIFGLVGFLSALSSSTVVAVVLWAITLGFMSVISSHLSFDGVNIFTWILDKRLWGEVLLSFGYAAGVRTVLVVILNVAVGAAVGFMETVATQWAWDRSIEGKRMSFGSWLVLLTSLPLAFLAASTIDGFIYQPLRLPQHVVHRTIQSALTGDVGNSEIMQSSYRSVKPFLDDLSDDYTSYFVKFSTETGTWFSAYVDVQFDNGFVMRCVTLGDKLAYCADFSEKVDKWIGQLVDAGLNETRLWEEEKMQSLVVSSDVEEWLHQHQSQMSSSYDWEFAEQFSSVFFVIVEFPNGSKMECRFRGATPVVVDRCIVLNK